MLTGKGILPLNFFWKRVADVIDIKAMKEAIIPMVGRVPPISTPNNNAAPINHKTTHIHCFQPTCSLRNGPAKAFVKIGCIVTISAVMPVGIPFEIEKKTPPK